MAALPTHDKQESKQPVILRVVAAILESALWDGGVAQW